MVNSVLEQRGREMGVFYDAQDLMKQVFPEPRWAVPGLVAEGLNVLAGAPKFGKSFLCMNLAVAVASGGRALGKIPVEQGDVLYAALEDPARRLQSRMEAMMQGENVPANLQFTTALPRMPEATDLIAGWLDAHPNARLVIIDVLRKIRPLSDGRGGRSAYDEDYDTLGALKTLADRYRVAVVLVHHLRKSIDDGDVFNEVSGSTGLTGAADAILIAKRARNNADAVLHITGRDITEAQYGLTWNPSCCLWSLTEEPVAVATMPPAQQTVHRYLDGVAGATPKEIADATGLAAGTVKSALSRMIGRGVVDTDGDGHYFLQTLGTRGTLEPTASDKGFHPAALGTLLEPSDLTVPTGFQQGSNLAKVYPLVSPSGFQGSNGSNIGETHE